MRITEFIEAFGRELPLWLAMPDDPVGPQVLVEDRELEAIAVAYELNERLVRRADEAGAQLIVTFHPLIYPSLRRIGFENRVERTVVELVDRRIALHVVHTAFDAHPLGTSALLATRLGLRDTRPLTPDARLDGAGMGAIGDLEEPVTLRSLAEQVRDACQAATVRVSSEDAESLDRMIRRVAILGGSGMSFYDHAVKAGAEAFVTADVRYHGFHAANDRVPVIDPGHAESERFVIDGLARLVRKTVEELGLAVEVVPLSESTNPVHYV